MEKYQVFTPHEYVNKMLDMIDYCGAEIIEKRFLENSCGEGNVLLEVVERYIKSGRRAGYSNLDIKKGLEKNIVGYEIDLKVIKQCKKNLDAKVANFDFYNVEWDIRNEDYLKTEINYRVDYIVGNPPYLTYQEIEVFERDFLKKNFISCNLGKFDYCYPFIEKSIRDLDDESGRMSYLIPTSIFKTVFGKKLREIMLDNLVDIYDYKHMKLFDDALVAASIIHIRKDRNVKQIVYFDVDANRKIKLSKCDFSDKWIFAKESILEVEHGKHFKDYFKISNCIATLSNKIFVIDEYKEKDEFIVTKEGHLIEKTLLKKTASPRSLHYGKSELIIFPYYYDDFGIHNYSEVEFMEKFPKGYLYLKQNKEKLSLRKSDKQAKWFEYGRSQALSFLNQEKLLLSSVLTGKMRLYSLSENVIPYSGFYIVPIADKTLKDARDIMESELFFEYIESRGINASGKSLRFSVKDFYDYPME